MTLILPSGISTYADSTSTEGEAFARKYVLAQFRSDAGFEWVREVRAQLVRAELKYEDLRRNRPKLKMDRPLWRRIESGVDQASIIVIDPEPFTSNHVLQAMEAGEPLQVIEADMERLANACAIGIIDSTPIAYLPLNLARLEPWNAGTLIASLDRFTPTHLLDAVGGGLRQAKILAARAHAAFDLASADTSVERTRDLFDSPLGQVMLAEVVCTLRNFDQESPKTVDLLNEVASEITACVSRLLPGELAAGPKPWVRELNSRDIDELQAADIAAGWARELIDLSNTRALGQTFERVWLNGRRLK